MSSLNEMNPLVNVLVTVAACFAAENFFFNLLKLIGIYTIVNENEARVYVLFGKVIGVITEPGLHFLLPKLGVRAFIVNILGQCHLRDLRLDQEYVRSNPVNSEEGAPMGIGVWYEMVIADPVAHVFKNADPRGSLRTNVSNATIRCLSNMRLAAMLENRHTMSKTVRDEILPGAKEWGYQVGSIYIRKVHFRDKGMVKQIEEKVVNRLRQVTSAIRQDGANQVSIISSTAEKEAAAEFARAVAIRSEIVGGVLQSIAQDKVVSEVLFEMLETQQILESGAEITLLPAGSRGDLLTQFAAMAPGSKTIPT